MKICRSYSYYAPVQCNDASAKPYSYIAKMGTIDADDCAQFCGKVPSPDLVGFNHITSGGNYCECLYSDQNIPAPPSSRILKIHPCALSDTSDMYFLHKISIYVHTRSITRYYL